MDWRLHGSIAPADFVAFLRAAPEHTAASTRASAAAAARAPVAGVSAAAAEAAGNPCASWSTCGITARASKTVTTEVKRRARYLRVDRRQMLLLLPLLFTMAATSNSML